MKAVMNVELKALLLVAFDGLKLGQDALAKNYFLIMGDIAHMITDVPDSIANISDLQNEIKALPGSVQQADLIQFIQSRFNQQVQGEKAHKVLASALVLVQDTMKSVQDALALAALIKS